MGRGCGGGSARRCVWLPVLCGSPPPTGSPILRFWLPAWSCTARAHAAVRRASGSVYKGRPSVSGSSLVRGAGFVVGHQVRRRRVHQKQKPASRTAAAMKMPVSVHCRGQKWLVGW
jgi:hypothetical protein